ncbi:MAG: arylamine N-acetyltransferase [Oscillospiraceae bacterium]|jgi:N-hydroxyarylamine O-acetyltransferase|nr:arylamine N-acetyltransferase [Oscillospiraceae bacterium]
MYSKLYEKLTESQAAQYLARIGLTAADATANDTATLDRLIFAHQCAVPFENLDVYEHSRDISLETAALFDKIVTERRGGYCFELNALFHALLVALGYDATPLIARVANGMAGVFPPLHRVTLVQIGGERYFCDVGFGGVMPAAALKLTVGERQSTRGDDFTFARSGENWLTLNHVTAQGASPLLHVCELPQEPVDFIAPNEYCSRASASYFRAVRLVNLRRPNGAVYITGNVLHRNENGEKSERELTTRRELYNALSEEFGIEISL